jgi:hypothetical protein
MLGRVSSSSSSSGQHGNSSGDDGDDSSRLFHDYGVAEGQPLSLSEPLLDSLSGYGASKRISELLVVQAARLGMPCAIVRPAYITGRPDTGAPLWRALLWRAFGGVRFCGVRAWCACLRACRARVSNGGVSSVFVCACVRVCAAIVYVCGVSVPRFVFETWETVLCRPVLPHRCSQ